MLRPDTQRPWDLLQESPAWRGFVLVGGTSLTLHLNHRVSGELDFMWLDKRLPEGRIAGLHRWLESRDVSLPPNYSAATT